SECFFMVEYLPDDLLISSIISDSRLAICRKYRNQALVFRAQRTIENANFRLCMADRDGWDSIYRLLNSAAGRGDGEGEREQHKAVDSERDDCRGVKETYRLVRGLWIGEWTKRILRLRRLCGREKKKSGGQPRY